MKKPVFSYWCTKDISGLKVVFRMTDLSELVSSL